MPCQTQELVTLSLSGDQLEAIEVFFAHNGWPLEILEQKEIVLALPEIMRLKVSEVKQEVKIPSRESTPVPGDSEGDLGATKVIGLLSVNQLQLEDFQVDDDACPHCFWSPCVTNKKPGWLGQGCPPKDGNTMLRKDRYLKYIKYLKEVGCWRHPAYILKKREALADKANRTEDMVWAGNKHVRELIPDCVVEMVRKMYPNPVGKGYDGEAPFFKIQDKNKPS